MYKRQIEKDLATKTKEDIYKVIIAAEELAKSKTGALIVLERDIKIQDIIATGIPMNAEVSPQLLVNIFEPKTPLHDGAVVISGNKIAAAACVLPLADDKDIAKELGTRHRAAIGISKESDSIVVVVSEETGKISVAKDGTLIADVREDVLKIDGVITYELNGVDAFADSSIVYMVSVTCKAPNRYSAKRAFFRLVKDTFDKEKIEIPYTTVDINVRK